MIEKSESIGEKISEKRIAILELILENPYITKTEISKIIGMSATTTWRNIEAMRGKYLRRVGPDKGGFWEVLY